MKTIVRLVQTTNKSDHMIVCMDEINTCVGCRITPTGSPNLDCIDNNQSSRQTIHHLRVLLLCARAVPAVRVCTCPVHACAHYTHLCVSPQRPVAGPPRERVNGSLPKFLPEQFLYIMDTPDSILVSVAAEMVAFQ